MTDIISKSIERLTLMKEKNNKTTKIFDSDDIEYILKKFAGKKSDITVEAMMKQIRLSEKLSRDLTDKDSSDEEHEELNWDEVYHNMHQYIEYKLDGLDIREYIKQCNTFALNEYKKEFPKEASIFNRTLRGKYSIILQDILEKYYGEDICMRYKNMIEKKYSKNEKDIIDMSEKSIDNNVSKKFMIIKKKKMNK